MNRLLVALLLVALTLGIFSGSAKAQNGGSNFHSCWVQYHLDLAACHGLNYGPGPQPYFEGQTGGSDMILGSTDVAQAQLQAIIAQCIADAEDRRDECLGI